MTIWLDANISPVIARFISENFGIDCFHITSLPVDISDDEAIFNFAKQKAGVIITSKDHDFILLQNRLNAPPKIIWLTFGNTPNAVVKEKLNLHLAEALKQLKTVDIVEIG
jgi:predicted nuclease of predicted toxin-antitoxin system